MYKTHWDISGAPLRPRYDSKTVYQGEVQDEAQARLLFLAQEQRQVGLVVGEHGSGKSVQLDRFGDRMRRQGSPVSVVSMIELEPEELLYQLATDFGLCPRDDWGMPQLWRYVTDRLIEYRYEQKRAIVLLDDADRATFDLSSHLMRLFGTRNVGESLLVVLGVHPETMHRIGRRLLELVDLRVELAVWSLDDTQQHIQQALEKSGCGRAAFKKDAIVRLHQLGHGIPRHINQLADLALVAGAGRDLEQVDIDTVESVYNELGTVEL